MVSNLLLVFTLLARQSCVPFPLTLDALALTSLLYSYDTEPSVLNSPLQSRRPRSPTREPSAKRKKLSKHASASTIAAKFGTGAYTGLDELAEDVEHACSEVLASIKANELHAPSHRDDGVLKGVLAFKAAFKKVMIRESQRKAGAKKPLSELVDGDSEANITTEDGVIKVEQEAGEGDDLQNSRVVLTIFGNAQGPKQLFSSLQQPVHFQPKRDQDMIAELDSSIDVTVPLREDSLPNIISTTKIVPVHPEDSTAATKRAATFGELFAPPATLPQLTPPKPTKQLTTRGNTVSFVSRDLLAKSTRRGGYFYPTEVLSTGQWLGYGGIDKPQEPSSTEEKRKQRDRALSTGETKPPLSEAALAALHQAKADALFRSVYSSFAPDHDNASAVVPEQTKSAVWWQKTGQKRYEETFATTPALAEIQEGASTAAMPALVDEDEALAEAVANFVPEPNDFADKSDTDLQHDKEVEDVLREISELLETLYSFQRIRHASLASNSRTPVSQNTPLTDLAGSPTSPSSAEMDVYKALKAQLSLMITSLPPYAVAKLNGRQLDELNISKNMMIEAKDYKGTMEEDQLARIMKSAAIGAAAGATPVARMASNSSHAAYSSTQAQYGRSTPSTQTAATRVTGSNAQSYFPQQQAPSRTPALQHQRSYTGSSQSYQTPAASSQRPAYASQTYSHHTPRPPYSQSGSQQYYQPRAGQQSYGQYYQHTPQTQTHNRNYQQQQPVAAYQQRTQNPPPSYGYGSSQNTHPNNASVKSGAPTPSQTRYNTASYAHNRQYYQPPATQGYSSRPATPSSSVGPNGYPSGSLSTAEQQAIVERQRAQLAMPTTRGAAQASITRPGSGTPQPPNSQYSTQVNGTPTAA